MSFVEGNVYTLKSDLEAWNVSDLNSGDIETWSPFSYVKNNKITFKAGTQFIKDEDSVFDLQLNEVAFKVVHEDEYLLTFKNDKKLLKAFGLK